MIIQIFTTTKTNQIIYQLCHKGTLICSGLVDALDSRLYLVLLTVTRLTIQTFEGCAHAITLQVGIELYTLMIQKTYYPVSLLCPHQGVTVSFLFSFSFTMHITSVLVDTICAFYCICLQCWTVLFCLLVFSDEDETPNAPSRLMYGNPRQSWILDSTYLESVFLVGGFWIPIPELNFQ